MSKPAVYQDISIQDFGPGTATYGLRPSMTISYYPDKIEITWEEGHRRLYEGQPAYLDPFAVEKDLGTRIYEWIENDKLGVE